MEQLKKTPKPREKDKIQYVGLDVFIGEDVHSYFGIIKGEDIIVARASMEGGIAENFNIIQLRLDSTVAFVPFIYDVLYRRIRLNPVFRYNDSRIIKKFSVEEFNLEVDNLTFENVMNTEKTIMSGLIDGTFTFTPYRT